MKRRPCCIRCESQRDLVTIRTKARSGRPFALCPQCMTFYTGVFPEQETFIFINN